LLRHEIFDLPIIRKEIWNPKFFNKNIQLY
jgi:hypothetical protein